MTRKCLEMDKTILSLLVEKFKNINANIPVAEIKSYYDLLWESEVCGACWSRTLRGAINP